MSDTLISEPKADKVFEVTEKVYPFRTKRVEANTAYYAAQKAFPATRFEHLTFRLIGRVIDAAVEAQKAETVRPPAEDEYPESWDDRDSDVNLAGLLADYWLAKERRQRDMAIRVASRLRRELAVEVTDPATWVCLRQWSDELAGDQ